MKICLNINLCIHKLNKITMYYQFTPGFSLQPKRIPELGYVLVRSHFLDLIMVSKERYVNSLSPFLHYDYSFDEFKVSYSSALSASYSNLIHNVQDPVSLSI